MISKPTLIALAAAAFLLTGCGERELAIPRNESSTADPMRIVSLDFCADQYVLKLVSRDRILALSPDADTEFSYMRNAAQGIPVVRPIAEDALILKPDLIVRSYGGGPNATAFFEQAGVPVLNVGWASDIEGVKQIILEMAEGLGKPEQGHVIVKEMEARLVAVNSIAKDRSALYMTQGVVTTGPGSLVHEMLRTAGLNNFQTEPGWRPIPLERLAYEQPDIVAAAFFDSEMNYTAPWSVMRHPIARKQLREKPTVMLKDAWTACGGWFLMDAIEALASEGDGETP